jgi:integrating conjugative element protein (TIGR03765 family)
MIRRIVLLTALLLSAQANAAPEIIADLGGRATGIKSPQAQLREAAKKVAVPQAVRKSTTDVRFPIWSSLRVGLIESYGHDLPVSRPFFIVGADRQSAQWLSTNSAYLKQINALGFVTNVRSQAEVDALQAYASDIRLSAIPVDAIAEQFSLAAYPVLVTQEEVMQ